jgi:hypothetical protein
MVFLGKERDTMVFRDPNPGEVGLVCEGEVFIVVNREDGTQYTFAVTAGLLYKAGEYLCLAGTRRAIDRKEVIQRYDDAVRVYECEGIPHPELPDTWIIKAERGYWP